MNTTHLMRVTSRPFPQVRYVLASPDCYRRFKILKGLLFLAVDLLRDRDH